MEVLRRSLAEKRPKYRCVEEEKVIVRLTTSSDTEGDVGVLFEDGTVYIYSDNLDSTPRALSIRVSPRDVTFFGLWWSGVLLQPSPNPWEHCQLELGSRVPYGLVPCAADVGQPQICAAGVIAYNRQSRSFLLYSSAHCGPTISPTKSIQHPSDSIGDVADFIVHGFFLHILRRAPPTPDWQGPYWRYCWHDLRPDAFVWSPWEFAGCRGDGDLLPLLKLQEASLRIRYPAMRVLHTTSRSIYSVKGTVEVVIDPSPHDGAPRGFFRFKENADGTTSVFLADCDDGNVLDKERTGLKNFVSSGYSYFYSDRYDLVQISYGEE